VAGTVRLGHAPAGNDSRPGLELHDLVQEQEWIAVREDRFDLGLAEWGVHRCDTLFVPDSLARDAVLPRLRGRFGREYVYVERCGSTQRLLPDDAAEGAVAVADEQTEGRGRLGRPWDAPPGSSVLVSVALRPQVPTPNLPELSLVAGRAVAAALAEVASVTAEVKWPNDVLLDDRKVAGVLAEAREGRVVLGIGINVTQSSDELPDRPEYPATSLLLATGRRFDRSELLVALLDHLEREYDAWVARYG
jgi:BirA family biotin operon repressor/biotin-[acetyl-CoA-carboxylase] ligase